MTPAQQAIGYGGVRFRVAVGPAAEATPAAFVFGVRKSGSSLLNSMVAALAHTLQLPYHDVGGALYAAGHTVEAWQDDPGLAAILRPGNLYGGFRDFPTGVAASPVLRAGRKLLLVRDPRDALVSEYFSSALTHQLPASGAARQELLELRQQAIASPLEAFVRERAPALAHSLRAYRPLLDDPLARVMRYEDCILRKRDWLRAICAHFGWPVAEHVFDHILAWADVLPGEERPGEFVRRVTPGDHRSKLAPAVIDALDRELADVMAAFGYPRGH